MKILILILKFLPEKKALLFTQWILQKNISILMQIIEVSSIENFISQKELIEKMKENNFKNCKYRNLSGGIVAIHSGWKV